VEGGPSGEIRAFINLFGKVEDVEPGEIIVSRGRRMRRYKRTYAGSGASYTISSVGGVRRNSLLLGRSRPDTVVENRRPLRALATADAAPEKILARRTLQSVESADEMLHPHSPQGFRSCRQRYTNTGGMPHRLSAHKPQTLMSGG
jgi:hypothetical protein